MVLNGLEMASGSIRINRAELQTRVLDVIGIAPDEAEERFGFLLRALRFGAPPHGGIAPGIDRIAMQLGDTDNLREVVAFPKLGGGADPLTGAPAPLPAEQLAELGLTVVRKPAPVSKLRACASTPITRPRRPSRDEAWEAMQPFLREHFGNASEPHWAGREARRGLEAARAQAADALGVAAADIVFTGGASEADNIAVLGRATRGPGRIVTTPLEHPAVSGARGGARAAGLRGRDAAGRRRRARAGERASRRRCSPAISLCSLIWASNLTGVIQPVAEAAAICAERGVPLHLDAVQACPALEVDIGSLPGESPPPSPVTSSEARRAPGCSAVAGSRRSSPCSSAAARSARCDPAPRAWRRPPGWPRRWPPRAPITGATGATGPCATPTRRR